MELRKDFCKEQYKVDIKRDSVTGVAIYEAWRKNGKLDRVGGPAFVARDVVTGAVVAEEWYKDGVRHRENGPAFIVRDAMTGFITCEAWFKDGQQIDACSRAPAVKAVDSLQPR